MKKLLLIDGHSILSRAYYGVPLLSASSGIHTNAVYGFLNILFKCIDEEKTDRIAVAFDLERQKLLRTRLYPAYKGTRKPMPSELLEQVPLIMDLVRAMNIPILTLEGYEADDLLGTVAKRSQDAGWEVTIVSGDRDLLQLCDEHIKISMPKTSKGRTEVFNYYPADVKEQYQVTPQEFIDLKALMGDTSDNIPGLPGVGEKTATEIIVRFGSIENAREHAEEVRPPRAQKALQEHYDLAELSKQLATIDIHAPAEFDPETSGSGNVNGIKFVKIHTRRTNNLRNNYSFRSVYNKCSAFCHQRKIPHKYFLLFNFIRFPVAKTDFYFQWSSIRGISGLTFLDIILRILRIHGIVDKA